MKTYSKEILLKAAIGFKITDLKNQWYKYINVYWMVN
jgi:hypothetical protein